MRNNNRKLILFLVSIPVTLWAIEDTHQYDWVWLNKIIDEKNITTIEDLLPQLPEAIRSEYVLMHTSRSIQTSDYQHPRVILHWDHAKRVLTFNSDPSYKGGNSIEMIQFDEEKNKFQFHRIDFEKDKTPVRDKDLKRCHNCHRQDARPNWESYFTWPGAYGANDDTYNSKEASEIASFISSSQSHPRYRNLINLDNFDPAKTARRSNIPFTERIAALNFKRIARLVRQTRDYDKYKFAILGTAYCNEFTNFFPENKKPPTDWESTGPFDRNYYTAKFRYIFESRGIPVEDLFMNFLKDPKTNRFTIPGWSDDSLIGTIAAYDTDLQKYVEVIKNELYGADGFRKINGLDCDLVAKKSVDAISQAAF